MRKWNDKNWYEKDKITSLFSHFHSSWNSIKCFCLFHVRSLRIDYILSEYQTKAFSTYLALCPEFWGSAFYHAYWYFASKKHRMHVVQHAMLWVNWFYATIYTCELAEPSACKITACCQRNSMFTCFPTVIIKTLK